MDQVHADDGSLSGLDTDFAWLMRKAAEVTDELVPLPRLGQVLGGKYRIEARLGVGGMGAVYRATHLVSQKQVALKWLVGSVRDGRLRKRFLREAQISARMDHPNVVNVYDIGYEGAGMYLVMELLRGEALRARLRRGRLQASEAVGLLLPAMRGVAAVHQAGVIHRDLKPDNIFLCEHAGDARSDAKVLDFGIAALVNDDSADASLTEAGAILGTPAYMSPEQLEGHADLDARSDVWAFGVMLYEALSGKLPFDGDTYAKLILAVVHQAPKPLAELCPCLPEGLEAVVMRALSKQRGDRYPTMDALMSALAVFAGEGAPLSRCRSKRRTPRALVLSLLAAACCPAWVPSDVGERVSLARALQPTAAVVPVVPQPQPVAAPEPEPQRPPAAAPRRALHATNKAPRAHEEPCDPPFTLDDFGRKKFKMECI